MKVIARGRGTGKTKELLTLAANDNGQVLTNNKYALRTKADNYGFYDLPIIEWNDLMYGNYDTKKPLYIDNAEWVFALLFEKDFELRLAGIDISTEN